MYPPAKRQIYDYSNRVEKKNIIIKADNSLIFVLLIFCVICLTVMGSFLIEQYEDNQNYWLVKYKWTNEDTYVENNETLYHTIYVYKDGVHLNVDCNLDTWVNIRMGYHVKLNKNCDRVIDIRSD